MWPFIIQYLHQCINADRQNLNVGTNQKNLLFNYSELKHKWSIKCYLDVGIRAKRNRIVQLKAGTLRQGQKMKKEYALYT